MKESCSQFANKLRFEGNYVHDVAHNGVQFGGSIIQSPKTYGFAPSEIKTGEILMLNNTFEQTCQMATDCGAVKFWGDMRRTTMSIRDVLVTGNIFRDTFGWTYISEKRQLGASGYGLFLDFASGIHAYRNIAYNNAHSGYYFYATWRDGDIVYYNNIAANSRYGMTLGARWADTHGSVNTQLLNNIIVNNEYYGIAISSANGNYPNTTINHNLYFNNGWNPNPPSSIWKPGNMMAASLLISVVSDFEPDSSQYRLGSARYGGQPGLLVLRPRRPRPARWLLAGFPSDSRQC